MKNLTALAASLSVPVFLFGLGCQKDDSATKEALQRIDKRLSAIERAVASGGGRGGRPGAARGRGMRPERPPGPNPMATYSVPIEGSAYVGPKHAKVTVVEGFEFA